MKFHHEQDFLFIFSEVVSQSQPPPPSLSPLPFILFLSSVKPHAPVLRSLYTAATIMTTLLYWIFSCVKAKLILVES